MTGHQSDELLVKAWDGYVMKKFRNNTMERGASLLEYAVLISMICLVAIVSVREFGKSIKLSLKDSTDSFAASGGWAP